MPHEESAGKKCSVFFIRIAVGGLLLSATIWSQTPSFNVPLDNPVYAVIDLLPLPVMTNSVSLSNRPFTRRQVCTLLVYAIDKIASADKKLLEYYLHEFSDNDTAKNKIIDISLDGRKTHAYPYMVTGVNVRDSGFSKTGFDASGLKNLSSSVEIYNKTSVGGRLYSNLIGILSCFDGAIITEYGSREQWEKIDDPSTGRNYTTIMAKTGKAGKLIGYDEVTAYVKPPLKKVDVLLGFDRMSWGYAGTSGLFLSGEGRPFLVAKASTTIGRLDYTFIIGKLTGDRYEQNRVIYAKHITYSPSSWFALGFSDGVISVEKKLKPVYLLPFAPYYFVEHFIGGRDNRIMSFDAQCNIRQHLSLYGELMIDEMTNLLGFVTNKKANDIWAAAIGVKWYNPVPVLAASLLKAEYVQLEPWMYTRYSRSGEALSNNPVDFGHPLGNQMGPHSRSVSLAFSGMLSEKFRGSLIVAQYMKGVGSGSDIVSGNDFVVDTTNGTLYEHQLYEDKAHRFKNFSRNRTVVSASVAYDFRHWLRAEISGDCIYEQKVEKKNYFRAGIDARINY